MLIQEHPDRFLIDHFNPDQLRRYESMRRNKFKKETVRRIVNQTLSQSVPPSVVIGISGYTKLLVGLLIERARDVQEQNAAVATSAYPSPPSRPQSSKTATMIQPIRASTQESALQASSFGSNATIATDGPFAANSFDRQNAQQDTDSDTDRPPEINHNDIFGPSSSPPQPPNLPGTSDLPANGLKPLPSPPRQMNPSYNARISSSPQSRRFPREEPSPSHEHGDPPTPKDVRDLGSLLPDDLREAFRRHKRNGENAGIGQGGLSLMGIGVQGTFAGGRGRGRRLFR